jgi:hypothetical protein
MKKYSSFTKLFAAFVVAISPASAFATTSPDLTATGSVKLSRPNNAFKAGEIAGQSSQVSFSAAIRVNAGNSISGEGGVEKVTSKSVNRVSNKALIEAALVGSNVTSAKGYAVVMVYPGNDIKESPQLYAFNRKTTDIKLIPVKAVNDTGVGLTLGLDWINFIGVYSAGANTVVSSTTQPGVAPYVLKSGSLRGTTGYTAALDYETTEIILNGVGSFRQTAKGITGSAKVAGVFPPME